MKRFSSFVYACWRPQPASRNGAVALCQFTVEFNDGSALFRSQDGYTVAVPEDTIARSSILHDTLCSSSEEPGGDIILRKGVLEAWLWSLAHVNILPEATDPSTGSSDCQLLQGVEAADFLNDADCLERLLPLAAAWLLEPYDERHAPGPTLHADRVQACKALPEHLLVSVLAASHRPLSRHLDHLTWHKERGQHMQTAALHAAQPSIVASAFVDLTLDKNLAAKQCLGHLLCSTLSNVTQLESLSINGRGKDVGVFDDLRLDLHRLERLKRLELAWACNSAGMASVAAQLRILSGLEKLRLPGNSFTSECIEHLATGFHHLKSLTALDLSHNRIDSKGAEAIAAHISHLSALRTLWLGDNSIGDEGMEAFAPQLTTLKFLQDLDLGYNLLEKRSLQALAPVLRHLSSLCCLGLRRNFLCADIGTALQNNLELPALKSIDLRFTGHHWEWFQQLGVSGHFSSLRTLLVGFDSNPALWFPKGMRVSSILSLEESSELSGLQKLDIGSNAVHNVDGVATQLKSLSSLTYLNLAECSIEASRSTHLEGCLSMWINLEHLNISDNNFHMFPLSRALSTVTGLTNLCLARTDLGVEETGNLLQCSALSTLRVLDLESTLQGLVRIESFFEHLGNLRSLQWLSLSGNELSWVGSASLAKYLGNLSGLEYLSLASCCMDDACASLIEPAIAKLTVLSELHLEFNFISGKGAHQGWGALLPRIVSLWTLRKLHVDRSFERFVRDADCARQIEDIEVIAHER